MELKDYLDKVNSPFKHEDSINKKIIKNLEFKFNNIIKENLIEELNFIGFYFNTEEEFIHFCTINILLSYPTDTNKKNSIYLISKPKNLLLFSFIYKINSDLKVSYSNENPIINGKLTIKTIKE